MKKFKGPLIFLLSVNLFFCRPSKIAINEIEIDQESRKEIFFLQEALFAYRLKHKNWPVVSESFKDFAIAYSTVSFNLSNFNALDWFHKNDTILVTYQLLNVPSSAYEIKSLTGKFEMYVRGYNNLFTKDYPIKVEMKDGVIKYYKPPRSQ